MKREFEELVENGEREFSKVRRKKIVVLLDDYHPAQPEGSATSQQRPLQDYYDDADRPVLRYNVLAESENMVRFLQNHIQKTTTTGDVDSFSLLILKEEELICLCFKFGRLGRRA